MVIAISALAAVAIYPQTSWADGFTSADLLKLKIDVQNSYFNTSVGMAGVIASQNRREAARCIDDWYFSNKTVQAARNDHIRSVMRKFPGYDPQATILAVIRKACGTLAK